MQKKYSLTQAGIDELTSEMEKLIAQRGAITERIKTAREFGDLSENAEYSAARQEQEKAEIRISEIEHILKNGQVIAQPKNGGIVELGNTVVLSGNKGEKTFTVVGSVEADPLEGKISDESPIGRALIGQKIGAKVEIKTPTALNTYMVKSIS